MATPVGEDNWLAYVEEETKRAKDLDGRVNVVELFKRATSAEPASLKIWLAYCEYYWSLFIDSQTGEAGWPEEEQHMGRELFSFGSALSLWSDGYEPIKFRLNDSHEFWNRWVSIELEQLARTRTPVGVKRITHLFRDRLQIPHATWDNTSQMFSSFLSEYNNAAYETEMKQITTLAQPAKEAYAAREPRELELNKHQRAGDDQAYKTALREYLDWEMVETTIKDPKDPVLSVTLALALYARALTGPFVFGDDVWHNYVVYLSTLRDSSKLTQVQYLLPDTLNILQRATTHCPGSGSLWSRYILSAEEAGWGFQDVESIKHAATTNAAALDKNGMPGVIDMYAAWCGYLKRSALNSHASEDAADVAEFGLVSAIEDVGIWGKRLYKEEYLGDPNYRLERILIQFLTEKRGDIDGARARWKSMADKTLHANSYDFWLNYYLWEMRMFSAQPRLRSPTPAAPANGVKPPTVPTMATDVLLRAMQQKGLDWPERIMEVCHQHCNDYEQSQALRRALDLIHRARRRVEKRRAQERAAAESAFAAQQSQNVQMATPADEDVPSSKRKRDEGTDEVLATSKRPKNEETATDEQSLKRDRENTSVMVRNLPVDATVTAIRKYFKDYGSIVNVTTKTREGASSALIEFETPEEMQSALLRDQKYFSSQQITVRAGTGLTLYVTNYPPTADEDYIRKLFGGCGEVFSIRFPSLKFNTHRRFCYVSFEDQEGAAKATKLDGKLIDGKYKLLCKYSNPAGKKRREGAVAEGRELRVKNISQRSTEEDLAAIFEKHGKVESVKIIKNVKGQSRGTAFVVMEKKEDVEKAAAALNKAQLGSNIIDVEVSKETNFKPTASNKVDSPAPSHGGDITKDDAVGKTSRAEIQARSMAILNLPDTVNDSRVRALVEEHGGDVVKVVLRPDRGGAIVEFKDVGSVGTAMIRLNGFEIIPNQKLGTGTVDELFKDGKAEIKKSTSQLMPPTQIRRSIVVGQKPKQRVGFATGPSAGSAKTEVNGTDSGPKPKSNADFKALFLGSKQQ